MQCIHLVSTRVIEIPSAWSQFAEQATWSPAPDFCIIEQVTMYLKGFFCMTIFFSTSSTILSSD